MSTAKTAKRHLEPEVFGPYSEWPRVEKKAWNKPASFAVTAVVAGVYLHCGLPLLV